MPSRRLAESPRLWISIALAAGGAATAFALRRDPPPPLPPEPEPMICVIPEALPRCADARPEELTTASGIRIVTLHDGCGGGAPTMDDVVQVHYAGWNARGEVIRPADTLWLPLRVLVPGVAEVVRGMRVGDKVRAWIPGSLAYDGHPNPKLRGTVELEIELLSFRPQG